MQIQCLKGEFYKMAVNCVKSTYSAFFDYGVV